MALILVVLVALAVARFGDGDQQVRIPDNIVAPGAVSTVADGCLGGQPNVDRALLAAQTQAPLTPAGAASFTATLLRWANTVPGSGDVARIQEQVLAPDATAAVRGFRPDGTPGRVIESTVVDGKYYVEEISDTQAIVSLAINFTDTENGVSSTPGTIGGTFYLAAVDGEWHLKDMRAERTLEDIARVGSTFAGGC